MKEIPVSIPIGAERLRGILHCPDATRSAGTGDDSAVRDAVLFLHGWSGSRLGPHRMFVKAARRLAQAGITCLRIDFRGRGDSDGCRHSASIATMTRDANAAVAFLAAHCRPERMTLIGICSGAKVAISTAADNARIDQLALWSAEPMGPLRGKATRQRQTLHALGQYARKAVRLETWKKVISGKTQMKLVKKAVVDHEAPSSGELQNESRTLKHFRTFNGRMLFVSGSNDPIGQPAARRYREYCRRLGLKADFHEVDGANHSYYGLGWEAEVIERTAQWLVGLSGSEPEDGAHS